INAHLLDAQKQQKAANEANLKRIEDSQRAAEESRRKDAELHRKEIAEKEAAASKKEEAFMNELRVLKAQQEQSRMMSDKLNKEEREKIQEARNKAVQAKEAELSQHRAEAARVLSSLHASNDQKQREHQSELKRINEDRIRQTERHGQQMRQLTEKKNKIINEMNQKMLTNQKEAYEWLLAQERTHLRSVTAMYSIIAQVPGAIMSDREAQKINDGVAVIRDTITEIGKPLNSLRNLILEDVPSEDALKVNLARRPVEAAKMSELCTTMHAKFTEIKNSSDGSQLLDTNATATLNSSIELVRQLVSNFEDATLEMRFKIKQDPDSITFGDMKALSENLKKVNEAIHAIDSVQGARAVTSLQENVLKFEQDHDTDYARLPAPPTTRPPPALKESTVSHEPTDPEGFTDHRETMDAQDASILQETMDYEQNTMFN
ncbi:hypothetical protein PENTCL1PPCAC_12747, partial [Pristionchus entomophagus]